MNIYKKSRALLLIIIILTLVTPANGISADEDSKSPNSGNVFKKFFENLIELSRSFENKSAYSKLPTEDDVSDKTTNEMLLGNLSESLKNIQKIEKYNNREIVITPALLDQNKSPRPIDENNTAAQLASKGYIIEYKIQPLFEYQAQEERAQGISRDTLTKAKIFSAKNEINSAINAKLSARASAIESEINKIDAEIRSRLKMSNASFSVRAKDRLKKISNAVVLDISKEEADLLASSPNIIRVTPNLELEYHLANSVPLVNANKVWSLNTNRTVCNPAAEACLTGKGIRIGIIDSGIDYTHPDLGGGFGSGFKVAGGYDFGENDTDPKDNMGHGTHVAATAAGNGTLTGVAPEATLYALKVSNAQAQIYISDVLEALEYAMDPDGDLNYSDRLDVVNMSLGGLGSPDDILSKAVDSAVSAGVVVVVSAGNSGERGGGTIMSPGTARKALTVGATDSSDLMAYFSSQGPTWIGTIKPDVAAPGVNICAAKSSVIRGSAPPCLDQSHVLMSGTSMAAPHVAGAVAILRQLNPGYTPDEIKWLIRNGAKKLNASIFYTVDLLPNNIHQT